ncbi:uncharacterized protein LOC129000705 isoform X2 [Macrosteles quadrilineatus]|nr:uncharacterized protein LOC129000705 isoform X2 [Macrosteles quadrilineatus]
MLRMSKNEIKLHCPTCFREIENIYNQNWTTFFPNGVLEDILKLIKYYCKVIAHSDDAAANDAEETKKTKQAILDIKEEKLVKSVVTFFFKNTEKTSEKSYFDGSFLNRMASFNKEEGGKLMFIKNYSLIICLKSIEHAFPKTNSDDWISRTMTDEKGKDVTIRVKKSEFKDVWDWDAAETVKVDLSFTQPQESGQHEFAINLEPETAIQKSETTIHETTIHETTITKTTLNPDGTTTTETTTTTITTTRKG